MKFLSLIAACGLVSSVLAAPTPDVIKGNPFSGVNFYVNPLYTQEVSQSLKVLTQEKEWSLDAQAAVVGLTSTAVWLDSHVKVPSISYHLENSLVQAKLTGKKTVVTFVIYDLPNRDCSAGASAGEYTVADNGLEYYKEYINSIKAEFNKYPEARVTCIIEPDSLGNLVTNLAVPKCAEAEADYKAGIIYAIQQLQQPNVALYLDAAHGGWLGWPNNRIGAVQLFGELLQAAAPATIRGFSTNVSNYNKFNTTAFDPITKYSDTPDELLYIQKLTPLLQNASLPYNFVTDTSRNGQQNIRNTWGDWCNIKGAGLGARPSANTGVSNVDAFLWVKTPGESDGTSNSSAPLYDPNCSQNDSLPNAPNAGSWFNQQFIMLVENANPPIKA
ncbi:hypothetical protein BZG36_04040 [Bifiguratus adelaidae]|uniref:Glucanase n=1 Tax=Bifiguratus adelaidae TaxID=1938954 RepID=A0A261Y073_9FUNG|nr:hypothetical protein BZG36_04040 [Bifiguratus adelaidae]